MKEGRRNQTKLVARWFRKNGQMFWSESHLVAIRGEAGEFLGVRGVAFDVTDRVRKDDELRWKTAFLEAQTDSALDGILVVDKDNRRLLQNQKLVEMWRVPEEIIKNPDDSQLLQYVVGLVKYPEQFLARVRQLYADPTEIGRDEVEFKDGRFLDRYSSPVLGKDGTYYGRIWTFRDITERKLAEAETQHLNKQLVEISRQAGMAEVATSVLHNVGNVLNSVNISCSVLSEKARKLRIESVGKVADILQANQQDLAAFFATDPIGLKLPAFLAKLAAHLGRDQEGILQELRLLGENVEHIKTIVSMQQSYARVSGMSEPANVVDLVNDSLRMNAESLTRSDIEPICKFSPVPSISVEKHKVLQILVNLIRNAKQACQETGLAGRQLILEVRHEGDRIGISVADNGVGILPEHLKRLFSHGFTTRPNGHGFGLHSSVLAAHDLGGRLHAYSEGRGCGATFTLELPVDGKPLPRE
jgi:signal transduction histidine kinase